MMKMMREGQLDFDVTGLVCFCGYQIYPTCTIADIITKGVELFFFEKLKELNLEQEYINIYIFYGVE